jgi:hypothetical protein
MKTDSLIRLLATEAQPPQKHLVAHALAWPLGLGLGISMALSLALIGFLPAQAFLLPGIWAKFVYALGLSLTLIVLLNRLYRPGAPTKKAIRAPLVVWLVMSVLGGVYLLMASDLDRAQVIFGATWVMCPWIVLGLSVPVLMALLVAARPLAPTDLKTTGFAMGLLAGSVGALGYSFACPETSITFVAIWYSAGIVLTGLVGRLLAPRILRW